MIVDHFGLVGVLVVVFDTVMCVAVGVLDVIVVVIVVGMSVRHTVVRVFVCVRIDVRVRFRHASISFLIGVAVGNVAISASPRWCPGTPGPVCSALNTASITRLWT